MLIPPSILRSFWKIVPTGVLHVGAHRGEEIDDYESSFSVPVIWIEAQPDLCKHLKQRVEPPSRVIRALVWNISGTKKKLHVTNNGQSSSVFSLGSHKDSYPDIYVTADLEMTTLRLDEILVATDDHNFLNLDIQGAEYEALEGLGSKMDQFDFVYCEVNRAQVYEGIRQVDELDKFLASNGFLRVASVWTDENWGDALYLKITWAVGSYGSVRKLKFRMRLFQVYLLGTNFRLTSAVASALFSRKSHIVGEK
jgi:FkbM family methyltransferase